MFCKYCNKEQPDNLFRKHSRKCKPCQAAYSDKWRTENPEKAKASRLHFLATHKEHIRAYNRKRWHTHVPWQKRNKPQRNASALANYYVRTGKLKKDTHCNRCGRQVYLIGHHADYSKPIEVEWICQSCHRHEHNGKTE